MNPTVILVLAIVGVVVVIGGGLAVLIASFYRKVDQGRALIVNKMTAEPVVTFTGSVVYPIIHRAEEMDISVKTIEVARRGPDGLICKDNLRADIQVTFFVRVNKTSEDVLKVAQSVGCNRASQVEVIRELFGAKFSEALKTVGKSLDFVELYEKRAQFRDEIIAVIGQDLNGYVLEDAAIDYLEQTPLEHLDKDNILDAQGIRKITELTTAQNVQTNELKQKERMDMASQNLTADEAIFRYDQQRAEAEARKEKEISIASARESNEAQRYTIDQQKETELSRQTANEEIKKREQDMTRGIQVAEKQRERVVAIESVEVQKAQQLKDIERERETELLRIDKEKALEKERKEIADVVRARVAVEKTVAEEEERINDLRLIAEAKRQKEAMVINAEGAAQSDLVKNIKAAEAQEEVAKFEAKELKIKAEAQREVADMQATAKIRLAEGVQAEVAAEGMAHVRVKEAEAAAIEKTGTAEANVAKLKLLAEAEGEEQKGMAQTRVAIAEAEAHEKQGAAEASVAKIKLLAQAEGEEQTGMATVRVKEADAAAIEKVGQAEAEAIRVKLGAEAAGLAEKASAMKELDGVGVEHEEFRIKLEAQKEIELTKIGIQKDIAEKQAEVLSSALSNAKVQIVGGDGQFFDRFVKAISVGNSLDGFVDSSQLAQKALSEYSDGEASLREDVKDILTRPALDADDLQKLSVSAILAKLVSGADPTTQEKLKELVDRARELDL